ALKTFTKVIKLDSANFIAYNNLGYFSLPDSNYKQSISFFDKSIALNPKFANAYNNRGFAKYKLKNYPAALEDINKSLSFDSKKLLLSIALGIPFLSFSQVTPRFPLNDSKKLILEGISLHDEDKYKEAIAKYDLVDRNDTNYAWSLYEKCLSFVLEKDYRSSI